MRLKEEEVNAKQLQESNKLLMERIKKLESMNVDSSDNELIKSIRKQLNEVLKQIDA